MMTLRGTKRPRSFRLAPQGSKSIIQPPHTVWYLIAGISMEYH